MKYSLQLIICICLLQACKSTKPSHTPVNDHTIENYTYGDLTIKVTPFGSVENIITIGTITKDGAIQFDWPEIDDSKIAGSDFFMTSVSKSLGMHACSDKQVEQSDETVKAADFGFLHLYKNDKLVGYLLNATSKGMLDNPSLNRHSSLVLGTQLYWYYSDTDVTFKASCEVNMEYEGAYSFLQHKTYDVKFKKGVNIVQVSLDEKEDWSNETKKGSLPKRKTLTSVSGIPTNINWYVNYWGS